MSGFAEMGSERNLDVTRMDSMLGAEVMISYSTTCKYLPPFSVSIDSSDPSPRQ